MKKGIDPLISHTLFIAIGIVTLSFLTMFIFNVFNDITEQQLNSEAHYISEVISDSISDLYLLSLRSNYFPAEGDIIEISKIALPLSSSNDYTIRLEEGKIKITGSSGSTSVVYERTISFDIEMSGASKLPGNVILQRGKDKGKIVDKIVLVD